MLQTHTWTRDKDQGVTLKQLCLHNITDSVLSRTEHLYCSIPAVQIPIDLSQEIFDFCIGEAGAEEINNVLRYFLQNSSSTSLRQINLQNVRRADPNLIYSLVKANLEILTHLDVRACRTLPKKFWRLLNKASKLRSLKTTKLLTPLRCPKLKILVVDWKPKRMTQRIQCRVQSMYYDKLLESVLENLTHLDLSWCPWAKRLQTLGNAKSLEALVLRSCDISSLINDISQLTRLRILDISVGLEYEINQDFNGKYTNPNDILNRIITSLPLLEYLDISGTNLTPTSTRDHDFFSALETRRNTPFKFLGLYSATLNDSSQVQYDIPAQCVTGSDSSEVLLEAIKRNVDMPKTLRSQIFKLRSLRGSTLLDVNLLLEIQVQMLKNLRIDEHFRFWALKGLCNFIEQIETPVDEISTETLRKLFLVLNRLNHSHSEFEKVSELSLRFAFQIFLRLLSIEELHNEGIHHEIMRLGKFLVSLKRTNFVYFKTEAILFRLLHRLSMEHNVCTYLGDNSVVPSCFKFFTTIQVYLGFSLRLPQTSEIVTITWESILSFMQASYRATHDFVKYKGLAWMYAHFDWFSYDERTRQNLRSIFIHIVNLLETQLAVCAASNKQTKQLIIPRISKELLIKVKIMIDL